MTFRYRQAHPDEADTGKMENPEEWFETDNQRELGQIFAGQSKMFDALRDIQRKMDDLVGRQERTLSLMSAIQTNQGLFLFSTRSLCHIALVT